ncbi:MAG: aldehyde dehydrogenase family protein [Sphingomonadales bacterium]|nr:aldehyde dehydrogenase family protein [Sphingomonadales bacterium]
MRESLQFYIDGRWTDPATEALLDVIDPATERPMGQIAMGSAADVDRAVAAAKKAFESYSRTSVAERLDLLDSLIAAFEARAGDLADAVREEMGAPAWLAAGAQVPLGLAHLQVAREVLRDYRFEERNGATLVEKVPIGVCAFITPWNWPINQISCKVAPALAVGCTMILKPSEVAPFTGQIFAEVCDAAGVPAGVFNLVHGDGPTVGAALSEHPDVDMVSFTGSTRAGIEVARAAAPTVKRVHQELGGKSANIVLPSADLARAVAGGVGAMMGNSGQSCNAPSRMLVPADRMEEAIDAARAAIADHSVGAPSTNAKLGPVVSEVQWTRIQSLIQRGIDEGARLVAGGPGRPDGLEQGYYVKPTVFADVDNDMAIAREEIFGPVLTILPYDGVDAAVEIANDTPYGLAAYVQGDLDEARAVASRLRAGQVYLNYPEFDMSAPFGGFKQSGNGREWGAHAFGEFLEARAVLGYAPAGA